MGNCSTNEQHIAAPIQSQITQVQFIKPKPTFFNIPLNITTVKKTANDQSQGIQSKFVNLNSNTSQQTGQLKLIKQLKNSTSLFVDNIFKAQKRSIGDKLFVGSIDWKRPSQFLKDNPILYQDSIQSYNLKQGKLQNSYFVSAFSAIAYHKQISHNIIKCILNCQQNITKNGSYIIWLFIDGNWKKIIIDDLFPVLFNQYIFSTYKKQLWIHLIQKAYAKIFKSYENIQKGLIGPFLTALTGAPCQYVNTNSKIIPDIDKIWEFLKYNLQKRYIMVISTQCNDRNQYFQRQSTFSYTVLDCQEVYILTATCKKLQRIIKLENPWGRYEWKGRWSEYSDVWSEELRHELDYQKADESLMWINVEDMVKTFGQICVCNYSSDYINTSLNLKFSNESINQFKGVYININLQTQGFLSLIQKDYRQYFKNYKYSMVRLILMQIDRQKNKPKLVIQQKMDCDYSTTLKIDLNPGLYYLLIELDWINNYTRDVIINIYANNTINMIQDPNVPTAQSIFYQLVMINQQNNKALEVYTYPHDPNIKRITGKFGGYVYYHYFNNSTQNKSLSQIVKLQQCKNVVVCGQKTDNEFSVKLGAGQQKLVKMKISNEGNGQYEFKPIINNLVVEKYSTENLMQMLKTKPTRVRVRQIDNQKIEVYVKMFQYAGGVALLYENRMNKYSFIQQIVFQIKNLKIQNDTLQDDNKYNLQLQPNSQKLLSFLIIDPSKMYVFKTTVQYYLSTPQFKF